MAVLNILINLIRRAAIAPPALTVFALALAAQPLRAQESAPPLAAPAASSAAKTSPKPATPNPTPAPTPAPSGPLPQVRVEGRIIEWQVDDSLDFDFAVQYDRKDGSGNILDAASLALPADPALSTAARIFFRNMEAGNGNFDAVIEALKGTGKVRILSQPSIVLTSLQVDPTRAPLPPAVPYSTSSGTNGTYNASTGAMINAANTRMVEPPWPVGSARLANTTQVPYALNQYVAYNVAEVTQYRDVGVTMDVLVQCVREDMVFLDTRVTVSDVSGFIRVAVDQNNNPQSAPMIDSRMIQNRLVIPDRTIFIAGLMKTTRQVERHSGIPWLSELPGLRWLLASRKKQNVDSELIFLVKPEIMSPSQPGRTAAGGGGSRG